MIDDRDIRLALLERLVSALRAEVEALKADRQPKDRKLYMRQYMAKRRAEAKKQQSPNAQQSAPGL